MQRRHARLLTTLAITQTVGYGVLYYAFAVLLQPLTTDLEASAAVVTGALTAAVVIAGLVAIPVGRWLDHRGGRGLMASGSALGTVAVAAWSQVQTVGQLYAVFVLIGLASGMALYEPAFAIIIRSVGRGQRSAAVLAVATVAGFASSIFVPLTGMLVELYGWRDALLVLAAIHGAITIPLHALLGTHPPRRPTADHATRAPASPIRSILRDRAFWCLAAAFVAQGAAVSAIAVHLVTFLTDLGHSRTFAASIAGLLGVLSVAGRLITTVIGRRHSTAVVTAATFVIQAVALAAFPFVGRTTAGAVGCVVAFGLGFGVATIARPVLLADRYGTNTYATVAGTLALPTMLAKAGAPLGAAALYTAAGSYTAIAAALAAASAASAGCLMLAQTLRSDASDPSPRTTRTTQASPR